MGWVFWEIGLLPAVFAALALLRAVTSSGRPWRQRRRKLRADLAACAVLLVVLGVLAGALHALGISGASGAGCEPSPNGKLCVEE